jgi:hypothetical protein
MKGLSKTRPLTSRDARLATGRHPLLVNPFEVLPSKDVNAGVRGTHMILTVSLCSKCQKGGKKQ